LLANDTGIRRVRYTDTAGTQPNQTLITFPAAHPWNIYGMRSLGAISLMILGAQAGITADPVAIEWDSEARLTWDDFEGPVPRRAEAERVASTAASIAWSYELKIEWSRDACVFGIVKLDSIALFHPESSWVRPEHRTAAILEHEQGHFDIAQLYNEKFQAETRELVGSFQACNGQSERQATRNAGREMSELVGPIYSDVWQQYRRAQETYDSETRHGIDVEAQARWTESIENSLEQRQALLPL
jgi:hypothetical protein